MTKGPTQDFRAANEPKSPSSLRDKDNAAPRPRPPSQARYPAPNVAPSGAKGIQPKIPRKQEPRQTEIALVSIVKTHRQPELLTGGRFTDKEGYGFAVEISPYRSIAGIEGGKINQLEIQHNGKIIAQYKDMEWTRMPAKEEDKQLVQQLQDKFGEPRAFSPVVPKDHDKDRGHER